MHNGTISTFERELAHTIADRAQIVGWDQAIKWASGEYRVPQLQIALMLTQAANYNDKADPNGRIEELEDYENEKNNLNAPEELKNAEKIEETSSWY